MNDEIMPGCICGQCRGDLHAPPPPRGKIRAIPLEKPVQDQSSENKQLFVDPDDESGQVKFE